MREEDALRRRRGAKTTTFILGRLTSIALLVRIFLFSTAYYHEYYHGLDEEGLLLHGEGIELRGHAVLSVER